MKACSHVLQVLGELWRKRSPGGLGFIGDDIRPSYCGDYFVKPWNKGHHEIRVPIKQPTVMESKAEFLFRGSGILLGPTPF